MDSALDRVEICGSTLATVVRELESTAGDSDGLLFGRLHRQSSQNLQDEGSSTREDRAAIVTGCCCTGSLLTFYDGAGSVDEQKLDRLTGKQRHRWGSDPIIGWFVARRASGMRPSMRESSVTANLCRQIAAAASPNPPPLLLENAPGLGLAYSNSNSSGSTTSKQQRQQKHEEEEEEERPFLFMLLTEVVSRENHVQTQEYRVFQYHQTSRFFQGRSVVVRNVGKPGGTTGGFVAVAPLPWLNPGASSGRPEGDLDEEEADSWRRGPELSSSERATRQKQQALLSSFAEKVSVEQLQGLVRTGGGVKELELVYSRMLSRMHNLAEEVRQSDEALRKQEDFNARLRRTMQ